MTTTFRPVKALDGTTIQGSLTVAEEDYSEMRLTTPMRGVVLDVYPSDNYKTRSAMQTIDRHGHTHECSVLIVNDGASTYMVVENVIIPPDAPSGLDDYEERLPRGSSILVDGEALDSTLQETDPYDLDGDWCVLSFIGGRIDAPYISSWWPHARNTFDTATSGEGSDGRTLVQDRRFFKRVNGVETVITSKGNIVISTTLASAKLAPGDDPKKGRFARNENEDEGGSIRINVKPSQYFELTFNPQEEGIGVVDDPDPELPQTNPPPSDPQASGDRPETYVYVDRDQIDFSIPDTFNVVVGTDVLISVGNNTTIETEKTLQLNGETIKLGENAERDPVVLGEELRDWLRDECKVLSPFGPLSLDPAPLLTTYDNTLSKKSVVE